MAAVKSGKQLAEKFRTATRAHEQGRYADALAGYRTILRFVPDNFDVLHLQGQCLIQSAQFAKAIPGLTRAVAVNPASTEAWLDLGLACRKAGRTGQARQAYRNALERDPDCLKAHLSLVELKFPGDHYKAVLNNLHRWLAPATYLEIGVETGESLSQACAQTHCIGIDPAPQIRYPLPPRCDIYSLTSDAFFAQFDPQALFGLRPVDFAFIDGLHVFEAALRDFIHVEQASRHDSVIAIHDCIPLDAATSARQRTTNFWSGDTWKLILALRKYRPDLQLVSVATKPTGLGLVTGLDPDNRLLLEQYDRIVEEFIPMTYKHIAANEHQALNVMANNFETITEWLQTHRVHQTQHAATALRG